MRCTSLAGFCHRTASHLLLSLIQRLLYVDDTTKDSSVQSHPRASCPLSCPIELSLISYFYYFLIFFLIWVCFSGRLCCSYAAPYISKHKAATAGKIGPLRLCSNVNVWSFIWSSDVILMMEELLLWTAGLVRSEWV